jgi:hypothetical protein
MASFVFLCMRIIKLPFATYNKIVKSSASALWVERLSPPEYDPDSLGRSGRLGAGSESPRHTNNSRLKGYYSSWPIRSKPPIRIQQHNLSFLLYCRSKRWYSNLPFKEWFTHRLLLCRDGYSLYRYMLQIYASAWLLTQNPLTDLAL